MPVNKVIIAMMDDPLLIQAIKDNLVGKAGFSVMQFATPQEITSYAQREAISALISDLRYKMKLPSNEKTALSSLIQVFPTAELRRNISSGEVSGVFESTQGSLQLVLDALHERINEFGARRFRSYKRLERYLNVRVDATSASEGSVFFCSNTYDISPCGGFILSDKAPPVDSPIRVCLNDFAPNSWVNAIVRWSIPWGKTLEKPAGFGVEFQFDSETSDIKRKLMDTYFPSS